MSHNLRFSTPESFLFSRKHETVTRTIYRRPVKEEDYGPSRREVDDIQSFMKTIDLYQPESLADDASYTLCDSYGETVELEVHSIDNSSLRVSATRSNGVDILGFRTRLYSFLSVISLGLYSRQTPVPHHNDPSTQNATTV